MLKISPKADETKGSPHTGIVRINFLCDAHLLHMWLRTGQCEMLLPSFWADLCSPLSNNSWSFTSGIFLWNKWGLCCELLLNKSDYIDRFPPLWTFFVTQRRTCQNVSLVFAACERDICLPSRLNIQRQSVSQWYPCGHALCWGSDPHRQKSYQNAQQQSDWPPPPPPLLTSRMETQSPSV